MDNKNPERFILTEEMRLQYEHLDRYMGGLRQLELFDEEEWDLSTTRRLWRIVRDADSRDQVGVEAGWVIGTRYSENYPQDFEEFKKREFAVFLRTIAAQGEIISSNVSLMATESQTKDGVVVANLKVNLRQGGTLLIDIANGTNDADRENVRVRAFGAKSPHRNYRAELDESMTKKQYQLRYIFKK